ncbi:MAG: glycosyl hydrolase [Candidatus Latescibacterota bacterium]|jgi:hypothetical protein
MNELDLNDLINPPAFLWPGYFWILNDQVDEQRMLDQLREMRAHDARSVCVLPEPPEFRPGSLATRLDRPYLTRSYLELIGKLVAECRRLGMSYWLYDEGGWPSGGACGRVCARNPAAFAAKVMADSEQGPALKGISYGSVPYPDLLNADATGTFIAITHEAHKPYIEEDFGNTVRFAFTDEPMAFPSRPGQLTWTDDLAELFRQRKGYDLRPFLADLLKPPAEGEDRTITQARVDHYDVWSRLFVERYLVPLRDWCHANGLLSAGHFGGEDEPGGSADHGFGHILRALRGLDLAGVDVIWRQLFPGLRSHQFPKYASSVARQQGQPLVLTESFAVYGNGVTPAQLKWVTDQQFVRGATLMVMACFPYSTRDHFMAGERPHFGPVDPLWKYMDLYHEYTARLAYLLTRGAPVCTTAVYFDIPGIWAGGAFREQAIARHDQVADELLRSQRDFDYVDDDLLAEATVEAGKLRVGPMAYDAIIVPTGRWMSPEARKELERFAGSGGRIIAAEEVPSTIDPVVRVSPACPDLRACKRSWGEQTLYFITNEVDAPIRARLTFPEVGTPVLCDPLTGRLHQLPVSSQSHQGTPAGPALSSGAGDAAGSSRPGTTVEYDFAPWGSAVILFGVKATESRPEFIPSGTVIPLVDGWTLRPLRRHWVGERDYEITELPEAEATPAVLGDWSSYLGRYFSGDVEYLVEFEAPRATTARLDLGEVRYACRIELNDDLIGRRNWSPFAADVTLRQGRNRLRVIVTNTLANALADPEVYAVWQSRLGNAWPADALQYDRIARRFEAESLLSGLMGPVTLALTDLYTPRTSRPMARQPWQA